MIISPAGNRKEFDTKCECGNSDSVIKAKCTYKTKPRKHSHPDKNIPQTLKFTQGTFPKINKQIVKTFTIATLCE